MKVLYLIHQYIPDTIGGTELLLHDLAENIQKGGHDVAIFAYHESPDSNPASFGTRVETVDGVRVYRFHFNLSIHPNIHTGEFRNAFAEQALNDVIEDFSPDVAHVAHAMKLVFLPAPQPPALRPISLHKRSSTSFPLSALPAGEIRS